jgi:DNA-binding transcriptional regulator YiaG
MKCYECAKETIERIATPKAPYQYKESGLSNVYLVGIKIHLCTSCKDEYVEISKIGQLNDLIAKNLIEKKEQLTGEELKFLRKYAGFPSNKFAALLYVDPSHLSRVEKGKIEHLGGSADKLARAITAQARDHEYTKNILLEVAEIRLKTKRESNKTPEMKHPTFKLVSNNWKAA